MELETAIAIGALVVAVAALVWGWMLSNEHASHRAWTRELGAILRGLEGDVTSLAVRVDVLEERQRDAQAKRDRFAAAKLELRHPGRAPADRKRGNG